MTGYPIILLKNIKSEISKLITLIINKMVESVMFLANFIKGFGTCHIQYVAKRLHIKQKRIC